MAMMFSFGVLSATVSRRYALQTSRGVNPLNLWIIVGAESGEGKSSVLSPLIEPLVLIQHAARVASASLPTPPVAPAREAQSTYDRVLADDLFDNDDVALVVDGNDVLRAMQAEQERRYPGVPLNFITRDATPQAVVEMMESQYMGLLQASSEGGFTAWISGSPTRATGDVANLNLAWDGRSDAPLGRVSRETRPIERACLSMVFSPQGESFRLATSGKLGALLRDSGYLPRFLYFFPESNIGRRTAPFESIPQKTIEEYRANVWAMLAAGTDATEALRLIRLSGGATRLYDDFFNELEPRLLPEGDLRPVSPWIERLRQNTARLAGVLHLAQHHAEGERIAVEEKTMADAIEIGRWLIPYGQRALAPQFSLGAISDPDEANISRVREVILAHFQQLSFSARDVHRKVQRSLNADAVQAALDALCERTVLASFREGRQTLYCLSLLRQNGTYGPSAKKGSGDT